MVLRKKDLEKMKWGIKKGLESTGRAKRAG